MRRTASLYSADEQKHQSGNRCRGDSGTMGTQPMSNRSPRYRVAGRSLITRMATPHFFHAASPCTRALAFLGEFFRSRARRRSIRGLRSAQFVRRGLEVTPCCVPRLYFPMKNPKTCRITAVHPIGREGAYLSNNVPREEGDTAILARPDSSVAHACSSKCNATSAYDSSAVLLHSARIDRLPRGAETSMPAIYVANFVSGWTR